MKYGKQKIKRTTADKWFSKFIRYRDEWTCQNPKCNKQFDPKNSQDRRRLHCAHVGYGRAHIPTRWEALNCLALCINCHDWLDQHPMRAFWLLSQKLTHQEIVWLQLQYRGRTRGRIPKRVEKDAREKYKLLCRDMGLRYVD